MKFVWLVSRNISPGLLFIFYFETGFHSVAQAGLQICWPYASALLVAEILGVCLQIRLKAWLFSKNSFLEEVVFLELWSSALAHPQAEDSTSPSPPSSHSSPIQVTPQRASQTWSSLCWLLLHALPLVSMLLLLLTCEAGTGVSLWVNYSEPALPKHCSSKEGSGRGSSKEGGAEGYRGLTRGICELLIFVMF